MPLGQTPDPGNANNNSLFNQTYGSLFGNPPRANPSSAGLSPTNININALTPPAQMQTLVYAPAVRILIAHGSQQFDVSKDVIRGQVLRKENSASTLFFTLANKGLRYNGMFSRMDRVTVYLKRINWQQVFCGYLDNVPYQQLYPGMASFKATCTIKRLMHTQWNPALPQSEAIFNQFTPGNLIAGDGQLQSDTGLGSLLQALLTQVGGWSVADIHIQNFPTSFLSFLTENISQQDAADQSAVAAFKRLMGAPAAGPPMQYAGYSSAGGAPGPTGAGQPFYIQQIVAACDAHGMGPTTTNLTLSSDLAQGGTEGEGSRDAATQAFAQNVQQTQVNYNTFVQHNDAAIIGVAVAAVETGSGATIRNLYNPAVPDSANFLPNDGPGFNGTSCGIFQQIDGGGWGTVSQRMNPMQAANMFFDRMSSLDWRNSDPGVVAWQVQQAADATGYAALVDAAIPWATQQVQSIRAPQNAAANTVAANPVASAVSSVGGAAGLGNNPTSTVMGLGTTSLTSVNPGSTGTSLPGAGAGGVGGASASPTNLALKPNPDSEGAVQTAMAQVGKPYVWGATGPSSFDCSGLMVYSYRSIGITLSRTTQDMAGGGAGRIVPPTNIQRGDLIVSPARDHVVMWLGNGQIIESTDGGVHVTNLYYDLNKCVICEPAQNGGVSAAAPRTDPSIAGPGMPPGSGGTGVGGTTEGLAANLFYYEFQPGVFADKVAPILASLPYKEYIDSQPLINIVNRVCRGSMRNFASGPDGSFIAYYPDYFGIDGKPAVVGLEDIELKDVHIDVSDDQLTTHVYVNGYPYPVVQNWDPLMGWMDTAGVVTIEQTWLYQRLTSILPSLADIATLTPQQLMARFGVRPYTDNSMLAGSHELEFLLACQIFMQKWAQQFQTAAKFTFLPELFPGMRVVLNNHNLQVYISEVTHTFDYEHGFSTEAVIMAPSVPGALNRMANTGTGLLNPNQTNIMGGLGGFDNAGTSSTVRVGGQ